MEGSDGIVKEGESGGTGPSQQATAVHMDPAWVKLDSTIWQPDTTCVPNTGITVEQSEKDVPPPPPTPGSKLVTDKDGEAALFITLDTGKSYQIKPGQSALSLVGGGGESESKWGKLAVPLSSSTLPQIAMQKGEETEEGDIVYSQKEIKAQSDSVRGLLGHVVKKQKAVGMLLDSEENLGKVRESMNDLNSQFNRYSGAAMVLLQMYSQDQMAERDLARAKYHEKEQSYELTAKMVGDWIYRCERNLGEQVGDSASMISKSSKHSKVTQFSKLSKQSMTSKKSNYSKSSGKSGHNPDTAKLAEKARIAGLKAAISTIEEEQRLKNKLEMIKLQRNLIDAEAKHSVYEAAEKKLHNMPEQPAELKEVLVEQAISSIELDPSNIRGKVEFSPGLYKSESVPDNLHKHIASDNVPIYAQPEYPSEALNAKGTSCHAGSFAIIGRDSSLNPNARPWPEFGFENKLPRPKSESGCLCGVGNSGENEGKDGRLEKYLATLQMPSKKLAAFSGDKQEYRAFIRGFESRVAKNVETESEKLDYLLQYVEGEAKEIIEDTEELPGGTGYQQARRILEKRYGQTCKATTYEQKLLSWPELNYEDTEGLEKFAAFLSKCLNAMSIYSELSHLNHERTLQRVVEKLPAALRGRWCDHATGMSHNLEKRMSFKDLSEFVEKAAVAANDPYFSRKAMRELKSGGAPVVTKAKAQSSSFAIEIHDKSKSQGQGCSYCGMQSHHISKCGDFSKIQMKEKRSLVTSKGLCWGCLDFGHRSNACSQRLICSICSRKHPTIMHDEEYYKGIGKGSKKDHKVATIVVEGEAEEGEVEVFNGIVNTTDCVIYHGVLPVLVHSKGRPDLSVLTYGLYDNGSTGCFVTSELKEKLEIEGIETSLRIRTMHGCTVSSCHAIDDLVVSDAHGRNPIGLPRVFTREDIPVGRDQIPRCEAVEKWPHLQVVAREMPRFYSHVGIGILIGSNCPEAMQPLEVIPTKKGSPYAVRLNHGWTVYGPVNEGEVQVAAVVNCVGVAEVENIKEMVVNLFEAEYHVRGDSADPGELGPSVEDEKFVVLVSNGIEHDGQRFWVPLPLKDEVRPLPDSRAQAIRRLLWQKKRMMENDDYRKEYIKFMTKTIEAGHAELIGPSTTWGTQERRWYLPHHGVIHPIKQKLRVVLDCSAKSGGLSLNDLLLQGPNYMNSIVGVLTRFRRYQVAICADVEAMFYQVRVQEPFRTYMRFLWWPDGDWRNPLREYAMTVHPFGAVSSPSVANFVLRKTGQDFGADEKTRRAIMEDFYVDDLLSSCRDTEEAVDLAKKLRECCKKGGFRLTKFHSNERDVIASIDEEDRAEEVRRLDLTRDELPKERTLGIVWQAEGDHFQFVINLKPKPFSRRGVLSVISSVYDPLGFVAPVILPAKKVLQELCKTYNLGWDDEIPQEHYKAWQEWTEGLSKLKEVLIDRCLLMEDENCELHCFSDASMVGTAAVIYLRQKQPSGMWSTRFVAGKARVAPLKAATTIPRLELSAAVMATQLAAGVRRELQWCGGVFFHTDSEVVLKYILTEQKRLPVFVSNRVRQIRNSSSPASWNYVNTHQNPADEGSRGLTAEAFIEDSIWLIGPAFLRLEKGKWQRQKPELGMPEVSTWAVEIKPVEGESRLLRLTERLSEWHRVVRAAARCILSVRLLAHRADQNKERNTCFPGYELQMHDLIKAERALIELTQRKAFGDEMGSLERGTYVARNSNLRKLDPYVKDGELRVGGRLHNSNLDEKSRNPLLLPRSSASTTLIIQQHHERQGHMGHMQVLASLREEYWVIGGASTVRNILSRCVVCSRNTRIGSAQKMASLPEARCKESAPFEEVGLDCFGPIEVKQGRSVSKRWGALFTCLSSRGTHLEVLWSMDTSSILNAIRRLMARRGNIREIKSDNGTNFVGAASELKIELEKMEHSELKSSLQKHGINWTFIPPHAPHMGGIWERQVKTVKEILSRMVVEFRGRLGDESLSTLFCEVEAIINNRPLTAVSGDLRDPLPLTPNQILTLKRKPTFSAPGVFSEVDVYVKKRWRQVQYLSNVFWSRWRREYLASLQGRSKWVREKRPFQIDDVVLIKEVNTARNEWPLGRVVSVQTARDDLTRVVTLRTAKHKLIDRGVHDLVLLVPGDATKKD